MNANKLKKQNSKKRLDDRTISGTDGSRNQASFGHPLTRTRLGFRSGRTNERTNELDNEQIDGRTDANSTTLHQQDQHQHQQHQPRRRRRAASVESGMADEKGRASRRRRRGGDESGRNLASRRQNWRHPLRSHGDTAWERHLAGHPQGHKASSSSALTIGRTAIDWNQVPFRITSPLGMMDRRQDPTTLYWLV